MFPRATHAPSSAPTISLNLILTFCCISLTLPSDTFGLVADQSVDQLPHLYSVDLDALAYPLGATAEYSVVVLVDDLYHLYAVALVVVSLIAPSIGALV